MADTFLRVTHQGVEVAASYVSAARVTHQNVEVAATYSSGMRITHQSIEVAVSTAAAFTIPAPRRSLAMKGRRVKQHAAFQAASHRRRTEVTSIPAASILPAPRKHVGGVFFRKRVTRRPVDLRRRATFVVNAAALLSGGSKAARHARFFVKKPARRPRNIRHFAALVVPNILPASNRMKSRTVLRQFWKRSNFRYFRNRRIKGEPSHTTAGLTYVALVT